MLCPRLGRVVREEVWEYGSSGATSRGVRRDVSTEDSFCPPLTRFDKEEGGGRSKEGGRERRTEEGEVWGYLSADYRGNVRESAYVGREGVRECRR